MNNIILKTVGIAFMLFSVTACAGHTYHRDSNSHITFHSSGPTIEFRFGHYRSYHSPRHHRSYEYRRIERSRNKTYFYYDRCYSNIECGRDNYQVRKFFQQGECVIQYHTRINWNEIKVEEWRYRNPRRCYNY